MKPLPLLCHICSVFRDTDAMASHAGLLNPCTHALVSQSAGLHICNLQESGHCCLAVAWPTQMTTLPILYLLNQHFCVQSQENLMGPTSQAPGVSGDRMPKSPSGHALLKRLSSEGSALVSHFDDWTNVLDSEAETSLSRRGSGKLHGLEPDMLRSTVDGLLKRQSGSSKLQPNPASPRVRSPYIMH